MGTKTAIQQSTFSTYDRLVDFEKYLGNHDLADNPFSFPSIVAADENGIYPAKNIDLLNQWNLQTYYIPSSEGGHFSYAEELLLLMRLLSRRDLTLAIGHGKTFLGALPTWIAGTQAQKETLTLLIKKGDKVSLGLTEQKHGSDIIANELFATPKDKHYIVQGTKWSINNIHGEHITLLAKTGNQYPVRNYSLLFIDKSKYPKNLIKYHNLKPVGLRSADLGSITFDALKVAKINLIGQEGRGLDYTLKTLQITRFMCSAFSLGALDTSLRITTQFLANRTLYNKVAIDIPLVKKQLLDIVADHLLCEFYSTVAARMLHLVPIEFGLLSAIAKSIIPVIVDEDIHQLSLLMGARSLFKNDFGAGIFQKMKRDHMIIPIFDGNTAVNQQIIIGQIRKIAAHPFDDYSNYEQLAHQIFDLDCPLAPIDLEKLSLANSRKSFLKTALMNASYTLEKQQNESREDRILYQCATRLIALWRKLDQQVLADNSNLLNTYAIPPIFFKYAQQFSLLHLASSCLNLWIYNKHKTGSAIFNKSWIVLSVVRILERLEAPHLADISFLYEKAIEELKELITQKRLISFQSFEISTD